MKNLFWSKSNYNYWNINQLIDLKHIWPNYLIHFFPHKNRIIWNIQLFYCWSLEYLNLIFWLYKYYFSLFIQRIRFTIIIHNPQYYNKLLYLLGKLFYWHQKHQNLKFHMDRNRFQFHFNYKSIYLILDYFELS